jgi:tetraacyldisaccharide 4'-kinase
MPTRFSNLDSFVLRLWYGSRHPVSVLLLPLSWLFLGVVKARRLAFRRGWLQSERISCPVIVVGNLTVGGTGKTPLIIRLATLLEARGRRVGIINRGYGGKATVWPRQVLPETPVAEVGDEAVLLAVRTGAIVVSGPDRVAAARRAVELGADVVLSDDGLQHYRLARDCEIAVVDASRTFGNGRLLPAGPLREPASRLKEVDLTVLTRRALTAAEAARGAYRVSHLKGLRHIKATVQLLHAVAVVSGQRRTLESFRGQSVRAVAAIGHPEAFFDALREHGMTVEGRAMPDHALLTMSDIASRGNAAVLMTEKDAVKCRGIADERHWAVPIELQLSAADEKQLAATVEGVLARDSARWPGLQ